MSNSKKTKSLLIKEIQALGLVESAQQTIVDDLAIKLAAAQKFYDEAVVKLKEIQDTILEYSKDKDK